MQPSAAALPNTRRLLTIEQMGDELKTRLQRLGVVRGVRNLKVPPEKPVAPPEPNLAVMDDEWSGGEERRLEVLLPGGRLVEAAGGACFVLDHVYPITRQHGRDSLTDLAAVPAGSLAPIGRDPQLDGLGYQDFLFLDTETTGLLSANTIAFMVGVAFYKPDAFVVRQYFLRDHDDEPAMLTMLGELIEERAALVTFNGRSFDLPLLDNRYLMNGLEPPVPLLKRPHLDLLPPARRLWRSRLVSCSLSSLEKGLLGVERTGQDIPGWAIPGLYLDYLRTGDPRPLLRVFYHNRIDMLSMATLAFRVLRQFQEPNSDDPALDLLSLARWQTTMGLAPEAEHSLRLAAGQDLPVDIQHQALHSLGALLRRAGRREEAVACWQEIVTSARPHQELSTFVLEAHVDLAKHFEWHQTDLNEAWGWTLRALTLVEEASGHTGEHYRSGLQHRLARLERKLGPSGRAPG